MDTSVCQSPYSLNIGLRENPDVGKVPEESKRLPVWPRTNLKHVKTQVLE